MSVELDVIPQRPGLVEWSSLARDWTAAVRSRGGDLPGVGLVQAGTNEVVELLDLSVVAWIRTDPGSTLLLGVHENPPDLREYLDDYGSGLRESEREVIEREWRSAGFHFCIESFAGRARRERGWFVTLAAALARATDGYVVVFHDMLSVPRGMYRAEQFNPVVWR